MTHLKHTPANEHACIKNEKFNTTLLLWIAVVLEQSEA